MTQMDNDFDFLTPVSDPALVNRTTSALMDEVVEDEGRRRETELQEIRQAVQQQDNDTIYELPAGVYNMITDEITRDAEVRELNGADEEALSRIKNDAKMLITMLERGTVRIGQEEATVSLLDSLLIGDRDALMIAIRRATFGDEVELIAECPHCESRQELTLSLSQDIPVRRHESGDERYITVECRAGAVEVNLPTGTIQKKIVAAGDRTMAEINTMLLAGCVQAVNGAPVLGADAVRRFGMADRAKLLDAIAEAAPGPRLGEVSRTCGQCAKDIPLPLTLSDIFRV